MLHVLRQYLPLRKALLILSETVLITLIVAIGMSAHLWRVSDGMWRTLAQNEGIDPLEARSLCLISSFFVALLSQLSIALNELYDFRFSASRFDRMARFTTSAGIAMMIVIVAAGLCEAADIKNFLFFPGLPFSQRIVLLTTALGFSFLVLYVWRNLFHVAMQRLGYDERLLILGSGRMAHRLSDELDARRDSGFRIVARLEPMLEERERRRSDRRTTPTSQTGNPWFEAGSSDPPVTLSSSRIVRHVEGSSARLLIAPPPEAGPELTEASLGPIETDENLAELAKRLNIDTIIVAFEERRGSLPIDELLGCRLDGIVVQEVESFYERISGKIPAEAMRPSYVIFNTGFVQHPLGAVAKRTADILLSGIGILLSWPAMLVTAILVAIDSPGSVLFRQTRTGAGGKPFTLCKFRSMHADAEKATGPTWATAHDPRITRVGGFIRRMRLDELPQLFNVLGGSMSLVGPRPERPTFVEELAEKVPYYNQRHIVKPGITGWAQVNYPYGNTVEDALQKLQYDLFYIKYQSTLFDLSILFNTIKTVLLRKGT